jgi:hypothetical protein
MRLGIPAAYDRMGTYYMNGTGVHADATTAYAFWQRAAQMGNPEAMTHLAKKMVSIKDEPERGMWSNIPIAIKMFECALSQGYGPAAYQLSSEYRYPTGREMNDEDRVKILNVLHEGVRLGCAKCAARLWIEFDHPDSPEQMMVPRLDKDRAKRYYVLADYLDFNPDLRFPNLDQVIPLPPAILPVWNGDKELLIQAAMGVQPLPKIAPPLPEARAKDRQTLAPEYRLKPSGESSAEAKAPFGGYWQPTAPTREEAVQSKLATIAPGHYLQDEPFDMPYLGPSIRLDYSRDLVWTHWFTVDSEASIGNEVPARLARTVTAPSPLRSCAGSMPCPETGIWQPWLDPEHPMHGAVNRHWRQAWVRQGERFPQPLTDWHLDLSAKEVTWHLMDRASVDIDPA